MSEESVIIGPLLAEDSAQLFRWINDRDLVVLNSAYSPVHEQDHADWFARVGENASVRMFAIRTPEGDLIGSCQLNSISPVHRSAELQIRIGEEEVRGKGFGTEALKQLIRFGFDDLGLRRIYLKVFAHNEAALATYRKVGFVEEGCLREAVFIAGSWRDVVIMALLAPYGRDADGAEK